MTTPGTITDAATVLRAIQQLLTIVPGLNSASVFIAAEVSPLATPYIGHTYCEIVPGMAVDQYARVGVGFVTDEVQIAIFTRQMTDQAGMDTNRITDSAVGVLNLVRLIDAALQQSFLGGILTVPLWPKRREPPVPTTAGGWSCIIRVYGMSYQVDYADPQDYAS